MEPIDVQTSSTGVPSGGSEGDTYYDTDGKQYYVKTSSEWVVVPKKAEYFGIFIGSPEYYYVGRHDLGYKKYIGYITCKFRANAPYGYTEVLTTTENTGDLETYPSFSIINGAGEQKVVQLVNTSNGSIFTYLISTGEKLELNGYTKTLTSSLTTKNPYPA
jgi:hypothetical protein